MGQAINGYDDGNNDNDDSVYCAYVLTLSPGSPLEEVNGSYCAGLCLNLYINKKKENWLLEKLDYYYFFFKEKKKSNTV